MEKASEFQTWKMEERRQLFSLKLIWKPKGSQPRTHSHNKLLLNYPTGCNSSCSSNISPGMHWGGLPVTEVKSPAHIPWHKRGLPCWWLVAPKTSAMGGQAAQQSQEEVWLDPLQRQTDAVTKMASWHHTLGFYFTAASQSWRAFLERQGTRQLSPLGKNINCKWVYF